MDAAIHGEERKNKTRGVVISVALHILLLAMAILPLLTFPDPPPGQEGILVNLGLPDVGQGEENAPPSESAEEVEETVVEEVPEDVPEEVIEQPEVKEEPVKEKPKPVQEKEVIKTEDPNEVALKKKEEERKKKEETDRIEREKEIQKQREEETRKRKAEAERQRKLEAARKAKEAEAARKKAEADKFKDQLGGLFGDGDGKGNTGKPGNQGDPNGDPNSDILEGISTGVGKVGGGLGGRGVSSAPKITDNSQEKGTVVVKVCVDQNGKVLSAEFTQRGSTAISSRLRNIAVANAKNWRFNKGSIDKQCGTITYEFKLR
ncbi:MAG: hypothetical protein GY705_00590 [Bacteroidetes bacterium]|nr:hypothetical protein [Bacteroidota bacterium]